MVEKTERDVGGNQLTTDENLARLEIKEEEEGIAAVEFPVTTSLTTSADFDIPEGGYGWVCVIALFILNGSTWGIVASYGVYLAYYLNHSIFPGARALDYALIGGLNFGVALIIAPIVTILVRKTNIHLPMLMGTVFFGAGFIAASFANDIWQLYLTQGVLVGLGLGFVWLPSMGILPQWFHKRRSLANGITSAGSGIGGLIFSLSTGPMISNISLAWSLRIIGILAFCMNLTGTLLIRDRNHIVVPYQRGFDYRLLRRLDVICLLSWAFISMFGYMALLYSLSDYALSIGLSRAQADHMTAFLNLGTALGRPLTGLASDRYGRIEVAGGLTFLCGLFIFVIWIPSSNYGVTVFFALVSGAILGTVWPTIAPLSAEVAGLKEVPSLLSLTWVMLVLPTTFSEVIALYLRDEGSGRPYLHTQLFSGLSYLVASVALAGLWWIKRREKRKIGSAD